MFWVEKGRRRRREKQKKRELAMAVFSFFGVFFPFLRANILKIFENVRRRTEKAGSDYLFWAFSVV